MTLNDQQKHELTKEKSLWHIYLLARNIPQSKFNRACLIAGAIIIALHVGTTKQDTHEMAEKVLKWSELGFGFAITTLGFLIAGFTVFATLSKPELMLAMARHTHEEVKLSYLKYNFFIFFLVFIYYLFFAGSCLAVMILAQPHGFVNQLVDLIGHAEQVKRMFVSVAMFLIVFGYLICLLQLKSFTFNIYHAVMTSIRWIAEVPEESNDKGK
jgi:hypothetical protein